MRIQLSTKSKLKARRQAQALEIHLKEENYTWVAAQHVTISSAQRMKSTRVLGSNLMGHTSHLIVLQVPRHDCPSTPVVVAAAVALLQASAARRRRQALKAAVPSLLQLDRTASTRSRMQTPPTLNSGWRWSSQASHVTCKRSR